MYDFLNEIPKAPRKMTPQLPYLIGKKKLGFFFKKNYIDLLTNYNIAYCAVIQCANMEELGDGKIGYSGMGVYVYTKDENHIKDEVFLKDIADKMRELRFKEGQLTEGEKKVSDALNNTSEAIRDFTIPTELTGGVTCYIGTEYLNGSYFEEDYVPPVYPVLLKEGNDGSDSIAKIDVKKYKKLAGVK